MNLIEKWKKIKERLFCVICRKVSDFRETDDKKVSCLNCGHLDTITTEFPYTYFCKKHNSVFGVFFNEINFLTTHVCNEWSRYK